MDSTCLHLYGVFRRLLGASGMFAAHMSRDVVGLTFDAVNFPLGISVSVFQRLSWGSACVVGFVHHHAAASAAHCSHAECVALHWTPGGLTNQLSHMSTFWPRNSTPLWFADRFLTNALLQEAMERRPRRSMLSSFSSRLPPSPAHPRTEYFVCASHDAACMLLAKFSAMNCVVRMERFKVAVGGFISRLVMQCFLAPHAALYGVETSGYRHFRLGISVATTLRTLRTCASAARAFSDHQ